MPELTLTAPAIPASSTSAATPAAPKPVVSGSSSRNSPAPAAPAIDVPIDGAKLGEWAKLNRTIRETSAKLTESATKNADLERRLAELEGFRDPATKATEIGKLVSEGKQLEAMRLAGVKLEDAFAQWVEDNENNPAPSKPPAELLELKAKYDELAARAAREDDAKKKADEDAANQSAQAQHTETTKGLADKIATDAARWPRCGKEPGEAAEDALGIASEKAKAVIAARAGEHGIDLSKALTADQRKLVELTDAEANELLDLSLDAAEAGYKALAEKYHVAPPARSTATVRRIEDYFRKDVASTRDGSPVAERKVAVTLDGQRGSLRTARGQETKGKLSEADARTRALASARSLRTS